MPDIIVTKEMVKDPYLIDIILADIHAAMIWPNDEEKRKAMLSSIMPSIILKKGRDGNLPVNTETQNLLLDVLEISTHEKSLHTIKKEVDERTKRGRLVGAALLSALGFNSVDNNNKISIRDALSVARKAFGFNMLTDNYVYRDIWPQYRSVAHLYAAFITLTGENNQAEFPCNQYNWLDFSACAMDILDAGLKYNSKNRRDSLLNEKEAWKIKLEGVDPAHGKLVFR